MQEPAVGQIQALWPAQRIRSGVGKGRCKRQRRNGQDSEKMLVHIRLSTSSLVFHQRLFRRNRGSRVAPLRKTLLNRVQRFPGFVYCDVRLAGKKGQERIEMRLRPHAFPLLGPPPVSSEATEKAPLRGFCAGSHARPNEIRVTRWAAPTDRRYHRSSAERKPCRPGLPLSPLFFGVIDSSSLSFGPGETAGNEVRSSEW